MEYNFQVIVRVGRDGISTQANMPYMEYESFAERIAQTDNEVYGANWTDNGLIYVAKMNAKGEFEPIENNVEDKAKAFDVLMKHCKVNDNWNKKISIGGDHKTYWILNTFSGIGTEHLTEKEYEILKKAGLE